MLGAGAGDLVAEGFVVVEVGGGFQQQVVGDVTAQVDGGAAHVGHHQHVVHGIEGAVVGGGLLLVDVEHGAEAAGGKLLLERGLVDDGAARGVEEQRTGAQQAEQVAADEVVGGVVEGRVQADDVAGGEDLLKGGSLQAVGGDVVCGEGRDVVDLDAHAEGGEQADEVAGDLAVADQAHGAAQQSAREVLGALPDVLALEAVGIVGDVAQGGEHVAHGALGDGLGKVGIARDDADAAVPHRVADEGHDGAGKVGQQPEPGGVGEYVGVEAGRAPEGDVAVAVGDAVDDLGLGHGLGSGVPEHVAQGGCELLVFRGEEGFVLFVAREGDECLHKSCLLIVCVCVQYSRSEREIK